jgi:hypothetical protein
MPFGIDITTHEHNGTSTEEAVHRIFGMVLGQVPTGCMIMRPPIRNKQCD